MKAFYALAVLALLIPTLSFAAPKFDSAYTSLENKDCQVLDSSEMNPNAEIDYFDSVCPGRDGYEVKLLGGDSRSWIGLLKKGEAYSDGAEFHAPLFRGTEGYFPNVQGTKLEWRYADGKLVAFILRMTAQDIEDYEKSNENLVVLRVDTSDLSKTCLVGSVNVAKVKKSNEAARAIADDLSKPCLP